VKIAITGASGNGKTTLAETLECAAGLRHVEIDALHHGPNWESCGPEVLRDRVLAATDGDDWVTDSTYKRMLGDLLVERADVLVWLDLPIRLVMWRLMRRTAVRIRRRVVLWNGNVESGWRDAWRYLLWPALRTAVENRRALPKLYPQAVRLRSDAEVAQFVAMVRVRARDRAQHGVDVDRQSRVETRLEP
jgi:adenylate kinase family enzyme